MRASKNTKKPKLLQIAELGHPVIRQVAESVANPKSPEIQNLIDEMIATCQELSGVGIAATQVYEAVRVMVVASTPTPAYPKATKVKPFALINPEMFATSKSEEEGWEGCMSIPGIRAKVLRKSWVEVKYTDRAGKKVTKHLKGFLARIFQHELDHLNGIVFLDKALPKTIITNKEFQKLIARKKK